MWQLEQDIGRSAQLGKTVWGYALWLHVGGLFMTLGFYGPVLAFTIWTGLAIPLYVLTVVWLSRRGRLSRPGTWLGTGALWLLLLAVGWFGIFFLPMGAVVANGVLAAIFPFAVTYQIREFFRRLGGSGQVPGGPPASVSVMDR